MKINSLSFIIFIIQVVLATCGLFFGFMPSSPFPLLVFLFPLIIYHISIKEEERRLFILKIILLSTIANTINLYWVAYPIVEIGKLPLLASYCVVFLLSLVLSLFSLLFASLVRYADTSFRFTTSKVIFSGLIWAICEYLQSFLFSGFPWLTLVPALAQWTPLIAPIAVIGSYLYSGLLLIIFCFFYETIRKRSYLLFLFSILLTLTYTIIIYLLYTTEDREGLLLNVAIIQGNIEQTNKWDDTMESIILNKYITLTQEAITSSTVYERNFDLIIWPETALPFLISPKTTLSNTLSSFINSISIPVLTGSIRYGGNAENRKQLIFNSALLFTEHGNLRSWYDKEKLVPFGEFTPALFSPFTDLLNVQKGGEFTSGENNFLLSVKNIPFGVLICYEIIFPSYTRKQVIEGANFLVTISNDAWFGYTRAAWQHLQHARLRAVEHARYLLRATNTGISAVITPKGHVLDSSPLFQDYHITTTIETQDYFSIYTLIAPYILPFTILLAFTLFLCRAPELNKRKKKKIIRRKI